MRIQRATIEAERAQGQLEQIGSVVGTITAGIGLIGSIGSLIGKSETEIEHDRILQEMVRPWHHQHLLKPHSPRIRQKPGQR